MSHGGVVLLLLMPVFYCVRPPVYWTCKSRHGDVTPSGSASRVYRIKSACCFTSGVTPALAFTLDATQPGW